MTGGARQRGQPAVALMTVLLGWTAFRMIVLSGEPVMGRTEGALQPGPHAQAAGQGEARGTAGPPAATAESMMLRTGGGRLTARAPPEPSRATVAIRRRRGPLACAAEPASGRAADPDPIPNQISAAGEVPLADRSSPIERGAPSLIGDSSDRRAGADRIRGDFWLVIRSGPGSATAPHYGDSQTGGVVRVPLGRAGSVRAAGYLRASAALRMPGAELATGLALRPAGGLPLQLAAEVRAQQDGARLTVRPAVGLATGIAVRDLPRSLSLAAFVQAGWVGGPGRTAYAEGVVRLDRARGASTDAGPRVGLGIWMAGQRGVQRLDVGPAMTIPLPDSTGMALRVEASWRQRLAGNAAPGSGPAILLAASF